MDEASISWGDYDNDGYLDLAIGGATDSVTNDARNIRNNGGSYVDTHTNLGRAGWASVSWGDYDNDGDLDLAISGYGVGSTIYRNDSGNFIAVGGLITVGDGSLSWGDYDNDGDLDLALSGDTYVISISRIYRNDGNDTFVDINAGLTGVDPGSLSWGDYDNDGDLDLALAGGYRLRNHFQDLQISRT